ncbi:MAG: hypothetical protein L0154_04135, partial [Chloroflexi bacterium]|nr:hypothetical protein [Chloroflexota bacterium]
TSCSHWSPNVRHFTMNWHNIDCCESSPRPLAVLPGMTYDEQASIILVLLPFLNIIEISTGYRAINSRLG